jgi:hypothetical protein
MMDHREQELLSAYFDDELETSERAVVDAHLPTCAACREMLAAITATMNEVRAIPEPAMPPEHGWALRGAIVRERKRGATRWRWTGAAGAAAASIVAIVVFTVGGGEDSSQVAGPPAGQAATLASGPVPITYGGVYDAAGARELLDGTERSRSVEAFGSTNEFPAKTEAADSAAEADASADIARCEKIVFEGDQAARTPVAYEVATWSDADRRVPAFFLVYRVEGQGHTHELWVVTRAKCETLYFAQG